MTRQVNRTTQIEVLEIYDELKLVIKKTGEDRCEYLEPHDDHSVAKKLSVAASSVASIRRAKFGRINEPNPENRLRQMQAEIMGRVAELQNQMRRELDASKAAYDGLRMKHDLLCTQLSASRVVDARHLRIGDPFEKPNGAAR